VRSKGPLSPDRGVKRSPSPSWEVSEDGKTRKLSFFSTTVHGSDRGYASPEPELGNFMKLSSPHQQSRLRSSPCDMQGIDGYLEGRSDFFMSDIHANNLPAGKTVSMQSTDEDFVQNGTIVRDFARFKQDTILKSKEGELKSTQLKCLRKCNEMGLFVSFADSHFRIQSHGRTSTAIHTRRNGHGKREV
jgi:hypothetical protein